MHMMVQHPEPLDLVIGSGESRSVRDLLDAAFGIVGLEWERYVVVDPRLYRPAEVDYLQADISKARQTIAWEPKTTFEELVREMVEFDMSANGLSV
jgi:GDPmannose 4,6-dehydratase